MLVKLQTKEVKPLTQGLPVKKKAEKTFQQENPCKQEAFALHLQWQVGAAVMKLLWSGQ